MSFGRGIILFFFLTSFSFGGSADIKQCSPGQLIRSLPHNLLDEFPEKPLITKDTTPEGYMRITIDYFNQLSDKAFVPSCTGCKSLAQIYASEYLKKLKTHTEWAERWQSLSVKNKVFDILLFMLFRVSQQKDPDYLQTLTDQMNLVTSFNPKDKSCQHLSALLVPQKQGQDSGIGLGEGVFITALTIIVLLCIH